MVSLWTAATHAARVDRMVVCCTSAALGPPQAWAERAALVRREGTGAVAEAVVDRWLTAAYRARHPAAVARWQKTVAATAAEGYAACCQAIERMDLRPGLPAIRAPTLAIAAAEDPATPPVHLERIAAGDPRLPAGAGPAGRPPGEPRAARSDQPAGP